MLGRRTNTRGETMDEQDIEDYRQAYREYPALKHRHGVLTIKYCASLALNSMLAWYAIWLMSR